MVVFPTPENASPALGTDYSEYATRGVKAETMTTWQLVMGAFWVLVIVLAVWILLDLFKDREP